MRTHKSGQSPLLLLDVVHILNTLRVPYAVIGAMAASYYGSIRGSVDASAVLSLTAKSLESLDENFTKAGFKTEFRRGESDDPIPGIMILKDAYSNRVDLLAGIRGLDPEAFERKIQVPFEGETLH